MSEEQPNGQSDANTSKEAEPRPKEMLAEVRPRILKAAGNGFAGNGVSSPIPGVVEVKFQPGIRPEFDDSSPEPTPGFGSNADANSFSADFVDTNFAGFNQLLKDRKLQKAEATFRTPPSEAFDSWRSASERGLKIPDLSSYYTLYFPAHMDAREIAQELNKNPVVRRAAPVPFTMPAHATPFDPLVGYGDILMRMIRNQLESQWYIFRCGANMVWKMGYTGKGVVIADVDWGFLTTHLDLKDRLNLEQAYNVLDSSTNVSQGTLIEHGTAVMGLVGAGANDFGMTGFAHGAELWPVQVNNGSLGEIEPTAWARAIEHVINTDSEKRKVLLIEGQTMSGFNIESIASIRGAIQLALANNIVVCVPAGNGEEDVSKIDPSISNDPTPLTPTGSIIVGATDYSGTGNVRADLSNFGQSVSVSAPGDLFHDLTCSDQSDTCYRNGFGGTSGATAKVAGAIALLLEINPSLSNDDLRSILHHSGSEIDTDPAKPIGRFLDCEAAAIEVKKTVGVG